MFFKIALATVLGLYATRSSAWVSAAHFGAAIESHSSTGFQNTLGSTVFFDVLRGGDDTGAFDIGLRTMATGARQADKEFYRLLTGPLVQYAINDVWIAQTTFTYFQESSTHKAKDLHYQSKGYGVIFGVEKIWLKKERIELTSGGFWGIHRGNLHYEGTELVGTANPLAAYANATSNAGQTRGIEISLRMRL